MKTEVKNGATSIKRRKMTKIHTCEVASLLQIFDKSQKKH